MKTAFKDTVEKVFMGGFKTGIKNLGKILFRTFINEPGGGLQFKLPNNIERLLKDGKIKIRNYFEIVGKGFTQTRTRHFTENLA